MSKKITLLLRIGTALIFIGLALLLVSAIPSYSSQNGGSVYVSTVYQHEYDVMPYGSSTLTPQQELYLDCTANQTLSIYILNVQTYAFTNEFNITYWSNTYNLENRTESVLQNYLNNHKDLILLNTSSNGIIRYTPENFVNTTIIFLNAADSNATLSCEYKINNVYAPAARLQQLVLVTIPLGFIFTIPSIVNFYKNRKLQKKNLAAG